ncbi:MAG: non-canonical purine NTP pyrophosphatase, RdgB/HAM1 family [Rickettsiales bacterium]|nr:non-canonical purine NTP pyrophosphatase, RdgB/HAM1 family [Rickettsiales bacterium]|tara:strand:- start:591 stop:1211 length:621 start_codon:yes stop_codon:yes gene_type:complete
MSQLVEVLLATGNAHKLREIREMLTGTRYRVLSLDEVVDAPEVVEDGDTFRANADKKARTLALHTGRVTIADDSGIEVDALDGAPGVYSARFSGVFGEAADTANNELLLERLQGVPDEQRTARFRCALAIVHPDGRARYSDGVIEGRIGHQPVGQGGFGYDPLFVVLGDPQARTTAELSATEKNAISHRGRALQELLPLLDQLLDS